MQDGLTLRFQTRAFTLWLRRRRARSHEETVAQRAHAMQTLAAIVAHWRTRRDAQCRAELGASAAAAQSLCVHWLQYWRHAAVAARECRRRDAAALRTNFVSQRPPAHFAQLYRTHNLRGGHVIKLGPGNDEAAEEAVRAWPQGLHLGGGIHAGNARAWIDKGAEKVIVTSYLFPECKFSLERLLELERAVGKERLVVDISCRRRGSDWVVAMNRWQDLTDMVLSKDALDLVSSHCRCADGLSTGALTMQRAADPRGRRRGALPRHRPGTRAECVPLLHCLRG